MKNENQTQNKKKTLTLTLAIACSLIFIGIVLHTTPLANAESPAVGISPGSQIADPGETNVCVQVYMNSDSASVRALNFKLNYPTSFTLTSFTSYKLLGGAALEVGIPITPSNSGYIDYAQAQPYGATPVAVNGNVATLCFTVASATGTYTLDLTDVTLLDASGNPLTGFTPVDGTIVISVGPTGPTANCNGPYTGETDVPVQFTGGATGGTSPYTYYWTFGDGGSSSQQNPTHTYSSADTYTVTLLVTDDDSETDTCTTTATITTSGGNPSVSISPSSQSASPGATNVCVQVHVNSNGVPMKALNFKLSYPTSFTLTSFTSYKLLGGAALEVGIPITPSSTGAIDYAQSQVTGMTPIAINGNVATLCFTVASATGTYTLDLTDVTLLDASGNPLTGFTPVDGTIVISVGPTGPTANCNGPYTGETDVPVQFTGGATGGTSPYTYYWTFGDGGSSSQQNPTHTYSSADTYTVTLLVTDDDSETDTCTTTATITSPGPIPAPYMQICPTSDTECPAHKDVEPNTIFCVDIMVNSGTEQVKAINVLMTYPTEFTMTSFTSYKLLGGAALEVGIPITPTTAGMIDYGQSQVTGMTPIAINGKLITMCFNVSGGMLDTTYLLNLTEVTLLDESDDPLSGVTLVDATRTITEEPMPTCSPDVNDDGRVNVLDMILVGQHWGQSNTTPGWIPEDTNFDGEINVLDMICIGQNWTG